MALQFKENPSKVVLLSGKSPAYLGHVPGYLSVSVMDNLDIKKYLDIRIQFKALPKAKNCLEKHFVHLRSHYVLSPKHKNCLKHCVDYNVMEFCMDYRIVLADDFHHSSLTRYNDVLWDSLHDKGY